MAGIDPGGKAARRSSGALESEILATLWATERPLTPGEIQAELGGGLAYNTVHTILKRLFDKGMVLRDVEGRRGAYRPTKNAAEVTAEVMHQALDRGPDPIATLQQFVTGLSPLEERALRAFLADADGVTAHAKQAAHATQAAATGPNEGFTDERSQGAEGGGR